MKISIVISADIKDAVNDKTRARNGGNQFTAALAKPENPDIPVAYISSWDTESFANRPEADANGIFDLRDQMAEHPWLSGNNLKGTSESPTGTKTVMRAGKQIAKVYRGEEWTVDTICADLGLVQCSSGAPEEDVAVTTSTRKL
jgi:hypothetical protein